MADQWYDCTGPDFWHIKPSNTVLTSSQAPVTAEWDGQTARIRLPNPSQEIGGPPGFGNFASLEMSPAGLLIGVFPLVTAVKIYVEADFAGPPGTNFGSSSVMSLAPIAPYPEDPPGGFRGAAMTVKQFHYGEWPSSTEVTFPFDYDYSMFPTPPEDVSWWVGHPSNLGDTNYDPQDLFGTPETEKELGPPRFTLACFRGAAYSGGEPEWIDFAIEFKVTKIEVDHPLVAPSELFWAPSDLTKERLL